MLYTSGEVKKPSGVCSVKWKAWGIMNVSVTLVQQLHGRFRLAVYMIVEVFIYITYPQLERS